MPLAPIRAASWRATAIFLAAALSPGSLLRGQDVKKRDVAILLPYESSLSGTGDFETAIQSVPFGKNVVFDPEYLDVGRFPDSQHEDSVVRYLRSKYTAHKADIVLAAGIPGLSFAPRHGAEVFGEAPIVFVGGLNRAASRDCGCRLDSPE